MLAVGRETGPAGGDERLVGLLESLRRTHHAVLQPATLLVTAAVQGLQNRAAEAAGFVEHRVQHIGSEILVARQRLDLLIGKQLVQHETHIGNRC